jgi:hypothetical protein
MIRSEIPEKRQESPRVLELTRELMQAAYSKDSSPQKVAHNSPSFPTPSFPNKGLMRR